MVEPLLHYVLWDAVIETSERRHCCSCSLVSYCLMGLNHEENRRGAADGLTWRIPWAISSLAIVLFKASGPTSSDGTCGVSSLSDFLEPKPSNRRQFGELGSVAVRQEDP